MSKVYDQYGGWIWSYSKQSTCFTYHKDMETWRMNPLRSKYCVKQLKNIDAAMWRILSCHLWSNYFPVFSLLSGEERSKSVITGDFSRTHRGWRIRWSRKWRAQPDKEERKKKTVWNERTLIVKVDEHLSLTGPAPENDSSLCLPNHFHLYWGSLIYLYIDTNALTWPQQAHPLYDMIWQI